MCHGLNPDGGRAHIGITCESDHPVFSVVGDALADRGHAVSFFDATRPIDRDVLGALSLFVNKHTRPASVRALIASERLGVPTWNSATGVQTCLTRFSQLSALEAVGFAVPAASRTKPPGEYVAKGLYHWDAAPEIDGEGDVYEPLLPAEPVDHKYYTVHDGDGYRTVVVRATSKLRGEKTVLGHADPVPDHVARIESLMDVLEMRALGVDLIRVEDAWVAVDLNPCPGFTETGLEDTLVASIDSCLD